MDISSGDFWIRILLSVVCGSIVGIERQMRGKPSGIRTSIFICLGTSVFISLGAITSFANEHADATRVLGQVITGIGFLGAGVIIAREGLVLGITSASVIWVLAGVGSMIGLGYYASSLALSVSTLAILVVVGHVERTFPALQGGAHSESEHQR